MGHMPPKLSVIAICLPLCAALPAFAAKQRMELVTTEHADFAPGGLINVEGSTGELNITGWDQPSVEIITTRYTFREERDKDKAGDRLKRLEVVKMTAGNGELTISTTLKHVAWVHLDYQIMVPRNSRLVIHHRIGDVLVTNVAGDIEATARYGDIVVQLPEREHYAIDAKCRFGTVYSDFNNPVRHFMGESLAQDSPVSSAADAKGPSRRVNLRVGTGGITVQKMDSAVPDAAPPGAGF
jgi:hypothetical protein